MGVTLEQGLEDWSEVGLLLELELDSGTFHTVRPIGPIDFATFLIWLLLCHVLPILEYVLFMIEIGSMKKQPATDLFFL